MSICVRCLVSGKVQGVFFRASTRYQAQQLGIAGYANNLPDGRVEVLACGEPEAIDQLKAWLVKGPPSASVSAVACEPVQLVSAQGFTTG
ncbi:acylphosphatase [Solemya velesiana gill symbiont]|uniref:acylphosphatase n=1 Tax=Solemya velesiana gill symbiont TaxID=1918948 RepID=A0A1T2KUC8_9GAMM|nr:acylphosphatase [Solemya velesiana gill symbiont]OOZ36434.1 acylphosphatase [Solemya velesiana gill symbiont]